jgi:hypothetical protein
MTLKKEVKEKIEGLISQKKKAELQFIVTSIVNDLCFVEEEFEVEDVKEYLKYYVVDTAVYI